MTQNLINTVLNLQRKKQDFFPNSVFYGPMKSLNTETKKLSIKKIYLKSDKMKNTNGQLVNSNNIQMISTDKVIFFFLEIIIYK